MLTINVSDQEGLQKFLVRRHPEYNSTMKHWMFCDETYNGGREWFKHNIFRYIKEGDEEHNKRLARCYRFNHTREVVDLIQKYIFKSPVSRNTGDAKPFITAFWENSTLGGLGIDQFMRLISTQASKFGRIWVFVDNSKTGDIQTLADEKKAGVRCYAYIVKPMDALDMGFADSGELEWILVRERVRDDKDPIKATGVIRERYRLWTQDSWYLFSIDEGDDGLNGTAGVASAPAAMPLQQLTLPGVMPYIAAATQNGAKVVVRLEDQGEYGLGRVPCFPVDNVVGDNKYTAPALIADIAYLDRATANYLSNLDAIIQDQTFSQLAMPAQNLLPGDDKYESVREAGTKRIFLYDGDGGSKPEYLTPDVKQAEIIVTVINKIINEIYHSLGMGGERTKQDNAVGIDNSSGVAKAYDFERLNSLLTTKSEALENAENEIVKLVSAWNASAPPAADGKLVKYADTFDIRSLYDEFAVAEKLELLQAPDTVRQQQMNQVVEKLFPSLKKDLKTAMLADVKNWPPDPIQQQVQLTAAMNGLPAGDKLSQKITSAPEGGASAPASKNPQTASRQGQVTSKTGS